ncbi:hypothetical protein PJM36_0063 [Salmonella phage vB_SenM_UTK0005]|uniref:Uncharacterized protein n=1 Tax=Salmonella phage vB-SalM-SJ2 TaxID=1458849 RepID=W8JDZ7_9CAUD|nr:hypothetical protein DF52_gp061 [Salmonella phage vB-SalM-SJ2]EDL0981959.1 hypothetical protein [Salmonella enterica subsp. enterica serovar Typhimurium]QFR58365.1 hypothetical protein AC3HA11_1040 [Escherichia phage vB_EcoM_3HA11]UYL83684.1 hypothetical protein GUERRERO_65 [Salmonella phage Guerrero]WDR21348.1 hypothetical protein PJM36_0063 [Salmonella phage vB_SenM_UTK0005]AHK61412.1 hypothetical protein [Salmonella phage vB-SalM-SJ2]
MSKEQIYKLLKAQEYLPGSIRWRHGSLNEHADDMDRVRFTTPEGKSYVIEYHTFLEGHKTFSDVYDIIEINPAKQMIAG